MTAVPEGQRYVVLYIYTNDVGGCACACACAITLTDVMKPTAIKTSDEGVSIACKTPATITR